MNGDGDTNSPECLRPLFREAVMQHPAEARLCAYHDGQADPVERAFIEAHLACCRLCTRRTEILKEDLGYLERVVAAHDLCFFEALDAGADAGGDGPVRHQPDGGAAAEH